MKYWRFKNLKRSSSVEQEDTKFDCQRFIELTKIEKQNLLTLKRFRVFNWWIERERIKNGKCFGNSAFENTNGRGLKRTENAIAMEHTAVAVLNREDYMKVLRKCQKKES